LCAVYKAACTFGLLATAEDLHYVFRHTYVNCDKKYFLWEFILVLSVVQDS